MSGEPQTNTPTAGERLRRTLIALDRALTGKAENDAAHMARNQAKFFADPTAFALGSNSDGYYLSDGGYSRLFYDVENESFRLSSVSRDEVKRRWREDPAAAALAAEAAAIVAEAVRAAWQPTPRRS